MTNKVADTIRDARRLLIKPGAWTKGQVARDKNNLAVGTHNSEATSWCMLGAIDKINLRYFYAAIDQIRGVVGDVTHFNDQPQTTLWDVVAALCKAENNAREVSDELMYSLSRAADVIVRMKKLLTQTPTSWCKRNLAQDAYGDSVEPCKPFACSWGIAGALAKEVTKEDWLSLEAVATEQYAVMKAITRAMPGRYPSIPAFNDSPTTTIEDVIKVLDEAERNLQNE